MTILLHVDRNQDFWLEAFRQTLPGREIRGWPDVGDPASVEYVVPWKHDWSTLSEHPSLRAVLLVSAGIDHVDFSQVPEGVPVVRLVDPQMSADIAEYVSHWVVHFARRFDRYLAKQHEAAWAPLRQKKRRTVGILGYGEIGSAVGVRLEALGYPVISWSRSAKDTPFGRHYCGPDELFEFCEASESVINILPMSEATAGLVSADVFEAMGDAVFVNVGRGGTVDHDALLFALDNHLRAAVLDVLPVEPLPADSPLWTHPKIVVTPHISGETNPFSAAELIGANIARIESGEAPTPIVTANTY